MDILNRDVSHSLFEIKTTLNTYQQRMRGAII